MSWLGNIKYKCLRGSFSINNCNKYQRSAFPNSFGTRRDKTRLEVNSRIGGTGTKLLHYGSVARENPGNIWEINNTFTKKIPQVLPAPLALALPGPLPLRAHPRQSSPMPWAQLNQVLCRFIKNFFHPQLSKSIYFFISDYD